MGDVDDQQAMEGQALGRVDAERDHSRGRDRSTSTLASASPAILCGKEGRTLNIRRSLIPSHTEFSSDLEPAAQALLRLPR